MPKITVWQRSVSVLTFFMKKKTKNYKINIKTQHDSLSKLIQHTTNMS